MSSNVKETKPIQVQSGRPPIPSPYRGTGPNIKFSLKTRKTNSNRSLY